MDRLTRLFEQTLQRHIAPTARLLGYERAPTPERERVYGVAAVQRYSVAFEDGDARRARVTLLVKDAPLVERRILTVLNSQAQRGVPYSHTLDLVTDALRPVCQQDLAPHEASLDEGVIRQAAERLAQIHVTNLGHADQFDWLPAADHAYFAGGFVLGNCWEQWDETMRSEGFARVWGDERSRLQAAADRFLRDMDRLWQAGDSLTLIHADLHSDHVLIHDGAPYVIDWGQARYGSFYLDLPNYFTLEQAEYYREALVGRGLAIPKDQFTERYRQASRYVAFKYLGYTMWSSRNGGPTLVPGRWQLFEMAVAEL